MSKIMLLGIDTAKSVFHWVGVRAREVCAATVRKASLRRMALT